MAKQRICVILTGGTICSVPSKNGKNRSHAAGTGSRLTTWYETESDSPFRAQVIFDIKVLRPDILSENMTAGAWDGIVRLFGSDIDFKRYTGIIVLHGTDTLAYTAAFLSFALAGIKIPVCMVSAQQILGKEDANGIWQKNESSNGYANFRAAVELIVNGMAPNVYAVYRNEGEGRSRYDTKGAMLVHFGAHLLQCPNGSNDFHSRDEQPIPDASNARLAGEAFESDGCLFRSIQRVSEDVLLITPHTNLDYSRIRLHGVKAVVHGTYHSESVCIGRPMRKYKGSPDKDDYTLREITKADRPHSILYLLEKCSKKGIPVFLAPCHEDNALYNTTANACKAGAIPVGSSEVTLEAVYAKAVLGCSIGKEGDGLKEFLVKKSINYEWL